MWQVRGPNLDSSLLRNGLGGKIRERKGKREKGRDFKERGSNFSLNFLVRDRRIPASQETKLLPTARATRGYLFCGVSTTPGG